jgi:hypothetical protein
MRSISKKRCVGFCRRPGRISRRVVLRHDEKHPRFEYPLAVVGETDREGISLAAKGNAHPVTASGRNSRNVGADMLMCQLRGPNAFKKASRRAELLIVAA